MKINQYKFFGQTKKSNHYIVVLFHKIKTIIQNINFKSFISILLYSLLIILLSDNLELLESILPKSLTFITKIKLTTTLTTILSIYLISVFLEIFKSGSSFQYFNTIPEAKIKLYTNVENQIWNKMIIYHPIDAINDRIYKTKNIQYRVEWELFKFTPYIINEIKDKSDITIDFKLTNIKPYFFLQDDIYLVLSKTPLPKEHTLDTYNIDRKTYLPSFNKKFRHKIISNYSLNERIQTWINETFNSNNTTIASDIKNVIQQNDWNIQDLLNIVKQYNPMLIVITKEQIELSKKEYMSYNPN